VLCLSASTKSIRLNHMANICSDPPMTEMMGESSVGLLPTDSCCDEFGYRFDQYLERSEILTCENSVSNLVKNSLSRG